MELLDLFVTLVFFMLTVIMCLAAILGVCILSGIGLSHVIRDAREIGNLRFATTLMLSVNLVVVVMLFVFNPELIKWIALAVPTLVSIVLSVILYFATMIDSSTQFNVVCLTVSTEAVALFAIWVFGVLYAMFCIGIALMLAASLFLWADIACDLIAFIRMKRWMRKKNKEAEQQEATR